MRSCQIKHARSYSFFSANEDRQIMVLSINKIDSNICRCHEHDTNYRWRDMTSLNTSHKSDLASSSSFGFYLSPPSKLDTVLICRACVQSQQLTVATKDLVGGGKSLQPRKMIMIRENS